MKIELSRVYNVSNLSVEDFVSNMLRSFSSSVDVVTFALKSLPFDYVVEDGDYLISISILKKEVEVKNEEV